MRMWGTEQFISTAVWHCPLQRPLLTVSSENFIEFEKYVSLIYFFFHFGNLAIATQLVL